MFKSRSIKLLNHPVEGWLSNFITLQCNKLGMKFEILTTGWNTFSPCCRAIKSLNHPTMENIRCDKFHQIDHTLFRKLTKDFLICNCENIFKVDNYSLHLRSIYLNLVYPWFVRANQTRGFCVLAPVGSLCSPFIVMVYVVVLCRERRGRDVQSFQIN